MSVRVQSNLIQLDLAAIINRLKEANERLFARCEDALESTSGLLLDHSAPDEVLLAAAQRLKKMKKELSEARLGDVKVFKGAVEAIEQLFRQSGTG